MESANGKENNGGGIPKNMKKICFGITLAFTFGWMLLIFGFSSQSGEASGGLSAMIAEPVTELLLQILKNPPEEARLYQLVDTSVRKAAHFCEYAILGGLLSLLFHCIRLRRMLLPWIIGTLYAVTDEWHQFYTPGRASAALDVLIDSTGVFFGILLCKAIILIWRKRHVQHS